MSETHIHFTAGSQDFCAEFMCMSKFRATLQEGDYQKSKLMEDIYPDFVMMANSFGVPARRVTKPEELRPAIRYPISQMLLSLILQRTLQIA